MYTFSEEEGYSFITTTTETYQRPSQTFHSEVHYEFTRDGYSRVQASDALFVNDEPRNTPKTQPQLVEQETEYYKCQTWYVPNKPQEKPSRSQEYRAPHKRFAGYDQTHKKNGRSNIRGHTISSSGDSSRYAQSRSQSRQPQHHCQVPVSRHHQRSASRGSCRNRNSHPAPRVSRERTQQRPPLMKVVNLTQTSKRTSTRKEATSQRRAAYTAPVQTYGDSEVRKVKGKWIKGYVEPKKKICFQFREHGCCSFGDRCKFEHVHRAPRNPLNRVPRYNTRKQQEPTKPTSFVSRNRFNFDTAKGRGW